MGSIKSRGDNERRLFAIAKPEQLKAILKHLLNEDGFLSPYGIRSVSRIHLEHPYELNYQGHTYAINYQPGESNTGAFGGNSNWRGPVWFPMNYLLIESLQRYYRYFGDSFKNGVVLMNFTLRKFDMAKSSPSQSSSSGAKHHVSGFVIVVSAIAAIGGLLFGYDTGVISGAILFIKQQFVLDSTMQEFTVSAVLIGSVP